MAGREPPRFVADTPGSDSGFLFLTRTRMVRGRYCDVFPVSVTILVRRAPSGNSARPVPLLDIYVAHHPSQLVLVLAWLLLVARLNPDGMVLDVSFVPPEQGGRCTKHHCDDQRDG